MAAVAQPSFPTAETKSSTSRSSPGAHTDRESDIETGFVDKGDDEVVVVIMRGVHDEDRPPTRHIIQKKENKLSLFYPCAYTIMGFLVIVILSAILVIFLVPEEDSAR
jgi:hypothetical protein